MADLDNYLAALRSIESSGNYGSVGPRTKRGDRAYGAYQVMGQNIPEWSRIATGQSMTPDQFLGDQGAQDAVAKKYFGDAVNKYGNPQDAASVWFSGRPMASAGNASDGYNTVPQYVSKFNKALGSQSGRDAISAALGGAQNSASPMAMSFADDGANAPASAPSAPTPSSMFMPNVGNIAPPPLAPPRTVGPAPGVGALPPQSPPPQQDAALPPNAQPTEGQQSPSLFDRIFSKKGVSTIGDALAGAGAGLLSINNPAGAAALQNAVTSRQAQNQPSWGVIGQDEWGNPKYGWINKQNQTVTEAKGSGGVSGTGSTNGGGGNAISSALASGAHGEELLGSAGIPDGVKAIVRGIANGSQPFNPATLMRTPQGRMVLATLDQYEPGVTPADYAGRAAGMRDWSGGKSAETSRRAGQAIQHAGTVTDAFDDLHNGSVKGWNTIVNGVKDWFGNEAPGNAKMGVTSLANEMGAFVRGNQGSDASFKEWASNFPINGSPEQQKGAMRQFGKLFEESVNELEQKRLRAIGPAQAAKLGPIMSPDAQAALDKIKKYADTPARGASASKPRGRVLSVTPAD